MRYTDDYILALERALSVEDRKSRMGDGRPTPVGPGGLDDKWHSYGCIYKMSPDGDYVGSTSMAPLDRLERHVCKVAELKKHKLRNLEEIGRDSKIYVALRDFLRKNGLRAEVPFEVLERYCNGIWASDLLMEEQKYMDAIKPALNNNRAVQEQKVKVKIEILDPFAPAKSGKRKYDMTKRNAKKAAAQAAPPVEIDYSNVDWDAVDYD